MRFGMVLLPMLFERLGKISHVTCVRSPFLALLLPGFVPFIVPALHHGMVMTKCNKCMNWCIFCWTHTSMTVLVRFMVVIAVLALEFPLSLMKRTLLMHVVWETKMNLGSRVPLSFAR